MISDRSRTLVWSSLVALKLVVPFSHGEPASPKSGAQFTRDGKLLKPADYREWVLIGTGLNMAYGPLLEARADQPPFTNVFVEPVVYREFLKSGVWPNGTMFVLEIRSSVPVNKSTTGNNGYYQGEVLGIEAEIKDDKRFAGSWAFFSLSPTAPVGEQIPSTASCYACHAEHGAVENTFVQFYPVLRDVAKRRGTFKQVSETF